MKTMQKITKAIIPAAGFGTRFLPATRITKYTNIQRLSRKIIAPKAVTILIGFVLNEVIPSNAKDNIFFNGYLLSPANRSCSAQRDAAGGGQAYHSVYRGGGCGEWDRGYFNRHWPL